MKYAITAATGHFGQLAYHYLQELVDIKDIVVIARNLEKAQELFAGADVRQADYDDTDSMTRALAGVDRVLFISSQPGGPVPREAQHQNVIDALVANNVSFVAYTSFAKADQSISALASDHLTTEHALAASGLSNSLLRNNWYLENEMGFITAGASQHATSYWATGRAGWALEREYAEAAVKVLVSDAPKAIYEFSGSINDYESLGLALAQATEEKITVTKETRDDYIATLEKSGLSQDLATLFASFQSPIDEGSLDVPSNDLSDVLGRDLTPLPVALKEILNHK
ncbi:NAD(P)H-binding protein [uncultured Leuconostoc sp.]|uniref:NAD(P)H-binding protein n=1 Tax=uncultured Leuconostoc sp. TaxID=173262 RepID=UPI0025F57F25|nr:NAD(P)H-binding protein [uncultured Leuconostoc sp.]